METIKTISSEALADLLKKGEAITIIDIRPLHEREEWHIPQSIHIDVYDQLKSGDISALDNISINAKIPVVALCAGGNLSKFATELLTKKGFDAYSLEGGMKAWNYAWDSKEIVFDELKIIQVRRVAKGCLSYIIGSGKSAMVVDASLDPKVYIDLATNEGWTIETVSDTHIHADYISRTIDLQKATNAVHIMHFSAQVSYPFTAIQNEAIIKIGNVNIQLIQTPGHTWQSFSFLINNKALLTGDTLFTDGIGRPDLKADREEAIKKAAALYDSLHHLISLGENVQVFPSHISKPISIGDELISASISSLKTSVKSLSLDKEVFIESILSKLPASPPNYLTIAGINKKGLLGEHILADLEAGANRCAIK